MIPKAKRLYWCCLVPEAQLHMVQGSRAFPSGWVSVAAALKSAHVRTITTCPHWWLLPQHFRFCCLGGCASLHHGRLAHSTQTTASHCSETLSICTPCICAFLKIHARTCFKWYGIVFLQIFRCKYSSDSHKDKNHRLHLSRPQLPWLTFSPEGYFFFGIIYYVLMYYI